MRWIVSLLLVLGAHFALTALIPGPRALLYWPFGVETAPSLGVLGASARTVTQLLAVLGGASFLMALLSLFHLLVPGEWFGALVVVGSVASALLYALYLGGNALIPLAIDALLLYGVLALRWTAAMLRGA